jgi:hypothetical protein
LLEDYRNAGITVNEKPFLPHGVVKLTEDGDLFVDIPPIKAFGNDGVAVHELAHIEQVINGLRNLTPREIADNPQHNKTIAEIGALKMQLSYLKNLPRRLRNTPAYKESIRQAEEKLTQEESKLPEGTDIKKEDLLNPYKKIIDF